MGSKGGLFGSGNQDADKSFKMTKDARRGENEALKRQRAIASGKSPSIAQMALNQNMDQVNRQAMGVAASQRGGSNPMLAMRQAQNLNAQNSLDAAVQGAMMREQERRNADEFLARQAAAQRGVAMQSGVANQQAQNNANTANKQLIGGMLGTAGKLAMAAAHGDVVPGEANVPGDSVQNDTQPYMLSPGEIVIPRSASQNREAAIKFLDAIKFDAEKKNKSEK